MPIIEAQHAPLSADKRRVLLINPSVTDTRFHWSQWHQPTTLLRLSTFHRRHGAEVKIVDALHKKRTADKLRRQRQRFEDMDGIPVPIWRFGSLKSEMLSQIRTMRLDGWIPDQVYVECFTTFWWEGAHEAIALVKEIYPDVPISLVGAYATLASNHAEEHSGANEIILGCWPELREISADLLIYETLAPFLYLDTNEGTRLQDDIINEIQQALDRGVRHFAFLEHGLAGQNPDFFAGILDRIVQLRSRATLHALGNISVDELVASPGLPMLMKNAGFATIVLADDRDCAGDREEKTLALGHYARVAELFRAAGYKDRTGAVSASVSIVGPHEDIEATARFITQVSHYIGSVIMWPYQPSPKDCSDLSLEAQNGKLFPLRSQNNLSYRDCLHLLSLGTVLNSKYRDRTFDFLGESLAARLFRESIQREAWDPNPDVKGTLQLPFRIIPGGAD